MPILSLPQHRISSESYQVKVHSILVSIACSFLSSPSPFFLVEKKIYQFFFRSNFVLFRFFFSCFLPVLFLVCKKNRCCYLSLSLSYLISASNICIIILSCLCGLCFRTKHSDQKSCLVIGIDMKFLLIESHISFSNSILVVHIYRIDPFIYQSINQSIDIDPHNW